MTNRVVITGLGVVSAIGIGVNDFWKSVKSGINGVSKITLFDTSNYPSCYGGQINNFNPSDNLSSEEIARYGRASQYAVFATRMAVEDSKLDLNSLLPEKTAVITGTTMGEIQILEEIDRKLVESDLKENFTESLGCLYGKYLANSINLNICRSLNIAGDSIMIPNACAAGNFAIGYAYDLIKCGKKDVVIAGGADPFSEITFRGFSKMRSMAHEFCSPFDLNRSGMIVGEGAGIIILESLQNAEARNAEIYSELLGYGVCSDAYHMVMPDPLAKGIIYAMQKAIYNAGVNISDIGYVCAHGTGTVANDKAETIAIKSIFKDNYNKVPISSLKSMIGHSMGAASAIETAACCLALKNNIIPPTINFKTQDPECDVDCVPNVARHAELKVVLNNAYAFGGNNSSIVLSKYFSNSN